MLLLSIMFWKTRFFFIMIKVIIIRLRHKLRVIYSFYLLKGEPVIGVELKIYLNQWKP